MARPIFNDNDADRVLKRVCFDHSGQRRWEPIEDRTPLDVLMDEELPLDLESAAENAEPVMWPNDGEPAPIELQVLKRAEAAEVAAHARLRLVQWIFGSGPRPTEVAMRLFALAWARYPELTGPMTGKDIEEMFGQGRAAFSARMESLFRNPVRDRLGVDMKVPGQKSADASAGYAENAKKHKPRAHTAHRDGEAEERARIEGLRSADDRSELLIKARREHERKEAAKTDALFEQLKEDAKRKSA